MLRRRLRILLVDDTDLSVPGKGQVHRTTSLYSRVSRLADVTLVVQQLPRPEAVRWPKEVIISGRGKAFRDIYRLSRDHDVIIAEHIYGINREALLASLLVDRPFVYDSHGNEVEVCWPRLRCLASVVPIEREFYRRADLVVTISDDEALKVTYFYGVKPSRIHVAPVGIEKVDCGGTARDSETKTTETLRALGVEVKGPLVVFHGNLDYGPNADALKVLLEISKDLPEYLFVAAGRSSHLRPRALRDNVIYVGYVDDLRELLCEADVAVAPHITGTGVHMKVVDYVSAGLPVVGFSKSFEGLGFLRRAGYPLLECPTGDVRCLTEALRRALRELDDLKAKARRALEAAPTWDDVARGLINRLERLVEEGS